MEFLTVPVIKRISNRFAKCVYSIVLGGLCLRLGACNTAFTDVQFTAEETRSTEAHEEEGSNRQFVYTERGGELTEIAELSSTPYQGDESYCTAGTVPYAADYSGFAHLAFSLRQERADAPLQPVEIQGDGISLEIQNDNLVPLQVQITLGEQFWCTPLVAHSGPISIPFDAFLSECWQGGNHTPFQENRIDAVKVVIPPPQEGEDATDFDICAGHLDMFERTPSEFIRRDGGYYECDPLYGYAWPLVLDGTTVDVSNFEALSAKEALCITGELSRPYTAMAGIGWNLAQEYGSPDTAPFEAMARGVQINYINHNPDYHEFRVQLTGVVASDFWCVDDVPTGGVSIPYESFRKECWDNSGDVYAKEPLSNILVQLVGDNIEPHPYHFCVESIGVY